MYSMRVALHAMTDKVFKILVKEEGVKLEPYRDHLGYWTIGIGHLIDRRRGGSLPKWVSPSFPLTYTECEEMCREDIHKVSSALQDQLSPWWPWSSEESRVLLVLMSFQLGVDGVLKFRRMIDAVKQNQWDRAAKEMRDSHWWRVQTPERAERMAQAMETQTLGGLG